MRDTTYKALLEECQTLRTENKTLQGTLKRSAFINDRQSKDLWRWKKAAKHLLNIIEPDQLQLIQKNLDSLRIRNKNL